MTVVHGGLDERELRAMGLDPAGVLDLSANLHPDGISPAVLEAAHAARLDRYPPADAGPLRAAIAEHEGVPSDWVLPTPGGTAAIHLLAHALLRPGDRTVVVPPTFGEYEAAVGAAGGVVERCETAPPDFEAPRVLPDGRLAFVAQPNNPTGVYLERDAVDGWLGDGRTLVLDAAYEAFVDDPWDSVDLVRAGADVAVVRSMTKLHAMPGVRLGYVVAAPGIARRLKARQPSWSLDAVAHAAGPVALREHRARVRALDAMRATRERMRAVLLEAGCAVAPSRANFLLVEVGGAAAVRRALLGRGILVRDCSSFGLPRWIRVAVPPAAHEVTVTSALLEVVRGER